MWKQYQEGIVKGADGKNNIETPTSVPFAFNWTECVVITVVNTVS